MIMAGMLITGSMNTIFTKWQNSEVGVPDVVLFGPGKEAGKIQTFTHPYFQTLNMFLGELLCLGVYGLKLLYIRHQSKQGITAPMSPGA